MQAVRFDIREAKRASLGSSRPSTLLLVPGTRCTWKSGQKEEHSPDTSFGEASSRTQATDPNRRETLRIRTPLPGLRGEAKWLRSIATPWSAKALTREVTSSQAGAGSCPAALDGDSRLVSCVQACHAPRTKGGVRWTLIVVRAEVGPSRRCPCLSQAHADLVSPWGPPSPDVALRGPGRSTVSGLRLGRGSAPRSLRWATLVIGSGAFPGRPDVCALIPLE
jgi:hypothetical protein